MTYWRRKTRTIYNLPVFEGRVHAWARSLRFLSEYFINANTPHTFCSCSVSRRLEFWVGRVKKSLFFLLRITSFWFWNSSGLKADFLSKRFFCSRAQERKKMTFKVNKLHIVLVFFFFSKIDYGIHKNIRCEKEQLLRMKIGKICTYITTDKCNMRKLEW